MKRTFLAIVAAMIIAVSASAQRLTDVTAEARLITDKMVLELGLNNIQRNSILQLNINYLNGKGKREFSNNSPEAIRMRQEMRRGAMKGAR